MDIYYFCFYLWEFSCILYIHPVADKSCIWNLWRFKSVFCLWIFPYGAILPCFFFFFLTSLNCTHGTPEVLYWACLFSVRGFAFVILARNCSGDSLALPWPHSKCSGSFPSVVPAAQSPSPSPVNGICSQGLGFSIYLPLCSGSSISIGLGGSLLSWESSKAFKKYVVYNLSKN